MLNNKHLEDKFIRSLLFRNEKERVDSYVKSRLEKKKNRKQNKNRLKPFRLLDFINPSILEQKSNVNEKNNSLLFPIQGHHIDLINRKFCQENSIKILTTMSDFGDFGNLKDLESIPQNKKQKRELEFNATELDAAYVPLSLSEQGPELFSIFEEENILDKRIQEPQPNNQDEKADIQETQIRKENPLLPCIEGFVFQDMLDEGQRKCYEKENRAISPSPIRIIQKEIIFSEKDTIDPSILVNQGHVQFSLIQVTKIKKKEFFTDQTEYLKGDINPQIIQGVSVTRLSVTTYHPLDEFYLQANIAYKDPRTQTLKQQTILSNRFQIRCNSRYKCKKIKTIQKN